MAYAAPAANDFQDSPSHSKGHRVYDWDTACNDSVVQVDSTDQFILTQNAQTLTLMHDGTDLDLTLSTGKFDFQSSNLETLGTITAEQLTSTDDITMQGHLLTLGNNTATDVVVVFDAGTDGTITYRDTDDRFVVNRIVEVEGQWINIGSGAAAGDKYLLFETDTSSGGIIWDDSDERFVINPPLALEEITTEFVGDDLLINPMSGFTNVSDTLTVNSSHGTSEYLILEGWGGFAGIRGGHIEWNSANVSALEGYNFVDQNNRLVWKATPQATATDAGVAWISFSDGSSSWASTLTMRVDAKINLRDSAIGIYSQADTFMDLFADGGVRIGDSSAGAPTNYSKFEPDGTLEFNGTATVFDDLRTPVNMVKVPASKAPTWTAYNGTQLLGFSYQSVEANEEEVYFTIQMTHGYKEGSDVVPHVHWVPNEDTTDDPEVVRWGLEYEWQNIDGTFAGTTTIWAEESMTDRANDHIKTLFAAIDGTGKTISSVITCRLFRNSNHVNDTYDSGTALALLLEIDFHFEMNTVGSRLINDSK